VAATHPAGAGPAGANPTANDGDRRTATEIVAATITASMTNRPIASARSSTAFRVRRGGEMIERLSAEAWERSLPHAGVLSASMGRWTDHA
jgi:hypothetical protein